MPRNTEKLKPWLEERDGAGRLVDHSVSVARAYGVPFLMTKLQHREEADWASQPSPIVSLSIFILSASLGIFNYRLYLMLCWCPMAVEVPGEQWVKVGIEGRLKAKGKSSPRTSM